MDPRLRLRLSALYAPGDTFVTLKEIFVNLDDANSSVLVNTQIRWFQ